VETVKNHYDSFLGPVYSWILGDFINAYGDNVELFEQLGLTAKSGSVAIDLGCGPGCQSVPLAERGYDVIAIDFCSELLLELGQHAAALPIKTVCADILDFPSQISEPPDLIVCMGDTLVHLPDKKAVNALILDVCSELKPGGTFVYSIRDYITSELSGADRFIPIRANDEQIFTCFLDYKENVVHVHDVLYKKEHGTWKMGISDYLKLRLDCREINLELGRNGLDVGTTMNRNGMLVTVATKPR